MKDTYILAIESSCDETAVAIIKNAKEIVANVVATQIDVHKDFGGVIPEVASRIHVENISMVIEEALKKANMDVADMDAIAVTQGPGLVGSLHVGVQAAKTLAWAYDKPLVPVHHIAGHIYANQLITELAFPLLALVVSGGHTELVYMKDEWSFEILGTTQDDAIGEAGDKVGRVLGLPYPGGVYVDKIAKDGKAIYTLAKPKTENELDFSFSGLKSSVLQFIDRCKRKMKHSCLRIWLLLIRKRLLRRYWKEHGKLWSCITLNKCCWQVELRRILVCVRRSVRIWLRRIQRLPLSYRRCLVVRIMQQ